MPTARSPSRSLKDACLHSGNSIRVGITGVPGAGKSSLIEALGKYLISRAQRKGGRARRRPQ